MSLTDPFQPYEQEDASSSVPVDRPTSALHAVFAAIESDPLVALISTFTQVHTSFRGQLPTFMAEVRERLGET